MDYARIIGMTAYEQLFVIIAVICMCLWYAWHQRSIRRAAIAKQKKRLQDHEAMRAFAINYHTSDPRKPLGIHPPKGWKLSDFVNEALRRFPTRESCG